ncbi:MAG: LysR family transcriptional regulator [Planctomycetia bacterium]|nr:LysR family transcriptional regulator [Planctomycetia bacterium]
MSKRHNWQCGMRVWLENDGHIVLGRGRVELLEAIERHRSIRQAAASIGMSYRRAWLLVQSINAGSDKPLVEATKGGNSRGGAQVTPAGKEVIRRFRALDRALRATAARVVKSF